MSDTSMEEKSNPASLINNTSTEIFFFYSEVFKFAKQYKRLFYPIIFAMLVEILYLSSLPLIIRKIFDHVLVTKNMQLLISLLSLIGLFYIAYTISAISQSFLATKISSKLIYFFRIQIFRKTNELPKKQLSKAEESEACRRFLGDVSAIDGQAMYAIFDSVKFLGQVICNFILLFYLEWRMAIFVIIVMRTFLSLAKFFSKKADLILKKKKQDADFLLSMVQETVLMRAAIYILQLIPTRTKNFNKNAELARESGEKFNLNIRLTTDSTMIAVNSTTLLMLCIGIYFVIRGVISIGVLLGFISLLFGISTAINNLTNLMPLLLKAANAFKEINKYIYIPESKKSEANKVALALQNTKVGGNIHFEKVVFNYKNKPSITQNQLEEISFTIRSKQFIGIVGTSGCGKSTLLKVLLGEYPVTSGKITLDGYDINELESSFLLSQFGVVMQETMIFDASIYDNIRLGKLDASEEEIIAAAKLAELHNTIMSFPAGYQENPLGRFSLGQEQRLAIARALVRNPSILCLDEATSALDPIDVDCVFVMDKGCLIEQGSHQELLEKKGFYYELWDKQNGITIDAEGRSAHIKPEWLKKIPIFSALSKKELKDFADEFVLERCAADKVIFNQGDYGDKFYLIAAGVIKVLQSEKLLATLSDGDFFGEIALLEDVPRTAKIVTDSDCTFLVLHHQKFKKMLGSLPEKVREQIKAKAAERQHTNK
jgi:ATP-binding cassette subfamily B protein